MSALVRNAGPGGDHGRRRQTSNEEGGTTVAKLKREQMVQAFQPYLQPGESVIHVAFGVKMPSFFVILFTGMIGALLFTKNYLVGLTDRRLIVLHVKSLSNPTVKGILEYALEEVPSLPVRASTGPIFTHIKIGDPARPFVAKFHRAYSKTNREEAMAIAGTLSTAS